MAEFTFLRATKSQQKARIALAGPSGSGKTWTALSIATGLGQSIAVIDTERGSASKYAADFVFDTCPMYTYDPRDLPKALAAAATAGYEVVIVDSLSHFWMGQGGMLEQVDNVTKRSSSGNSFGGWKEMRPAERAMIDALLAYPGHLLVTMRTKTEWVVTENERGRKEPKKIGTKPEQRDGIEYEFDVVGDMDHEHTLIVSKSRISTLADEVIARPGPELGTRIREWLTDGVKLPTVADYLADLSAAADFDAVGRVFGAVKARNLTGAPCQDEHGEATTLGALIIAKGNALKPPASAEPPMADQALLRTVNTQVGKRVGSNREDRLAFIGDILGREIGSSSELTADEARRVLEAMAKADEQNARQAGPPEGWTPEQSDQLAADFLAELQAARTDADRAIIAKRIGGAVKAGKLTDADRETLLAAYTGRQPQHAGAAS